MSTHSLDPVWTSHIYISQLKLPTCVQYCGPSHTWTDIQQNVSSVVVIVFYVCFISLPCAVWTSHIYISQLKLPTCVQYCGPSHTWTDIQQNVSSVVVIVFYVCFISLPCAVWTSHIYISQLKLPTCVQYCGPSHTWTDIQQNVSSVVVIVFYVCQTHCFISLPCTVCSTRTVLHRAQPFEEPEGP